MQDKINDFVDNVMLAGEDTKLSLKDKLNIWHEDYNQEQKKFKITLLARLLGEYFEDDISQKFFDMYFSNILVSFYKKRIIL